MSLPADPQSSGTVEAAIGELCHVCGMCCDGTLFVTVPLRPTDRPEHLETLGPTLGHARDASWLNLPCAAHRDLSCAIYAERPAQCRVFECQLLQEVILGRRSLEAAHRIIQHTRQQADTVRALLRQCGHDDEIVPLSRRYQQACEKNGAKSVPDGELRLAMLKLTQLLELSFYTPEKPVP
jgi:hypothetical protein